MKQKIVSFDYDRTLSREDIQQYAAELIQRGYEVHVVTARYNELQKHAWVASPHNDDLWEVIDKLGIPHRYVHFTNMLLKAEVIFKNAPQVLFHLDDCPVETKEINDLTQVKGVVLCNSGAWKDKCEKILEEYENPKPVKKRTKKTTTSI
jgi:hypothetical protein